MFEQHEQSPGQEVAKLERFYQNRLLELEEELDNHSERPTVVESDFIKEGRSYNYQMRILEYECLMANVPTDRIPGLIESFAKRFGINLTSQNIPVKSAAENMVVEFGLLSDLQIAEVLYSTDNITIGMDAATQEGCHVNEIHMTTENRCLVVALDELPGDTARDYADHVVRSVEHLASVHCVFNEVSEEVMPMKDVYKTMSTHITCSLTDRAAANHAAIRIINEKFGTTLVEVNCHLHPLDTIASKTKSTLQLLETSKSKLFGSGCRAEKVILAMNKMRFKDGKGDPHGFRVFLKDNDLPQSLIVRYRGNRLHVLFKLAATYITHYTDMKTYLTKRCLNNSELKTCLIKDYIDDPTTKLQLRVLAIVANSSLDLGSNDSIAAKRKKYTTSMPSLQSRNDIVVWRHSRQRTRSF